jgi:hypothetical protein
VKVSTLAKIFGFLVLVCSVAFAMTAFVLRQEAMNWKKAKEDTERMLNETINELKAANVTLKADLEKAVQARQAAESQANDFKEKLKERDAQIAVLNGQVGDLEASKKRLEDDVAAIKEQLRVQLANNQRLDAAERAAQAARVAAEEARRKAEDELAACQDDLRNLRNQLKITVGDLRGATDLIERYFQVYGEEGKRLAEAAAAPVRQISGRVTQADNPSGIIMISVGKDDGVRTDMTFEVVRPDARQFIGRIRVTDVHDEEAICRVVGPMSPNVIREGDHVTTRVQ